MRPGFCSATFVLNRMPKFKQAIFSGVQIDNKELFDLKSVRFGFTELSFCACLPRQGRQVQKPQDIYN